MSRPDLASDVRLGQRGFPMSDKQISIHIDPTEQREDILTEQVENCPACNTHLETSFGLGGGGFGVYGYCETCERIIWKCQVEE